jgi:DNA-binding HxlR family transcriptional regulator
MLTKEGCPGNMLAIKDAIEVIEGRWKLPIMIAISKGSKRFSEIGKEIRISDKMLSRELKALEEHKLLTRTATDSFPPIVEYAITEHGMSLGKLMQELYQWGQEHRKQVLGS